MNAFDSAFTQAAGSAGDYFHSAVDTIDKKFGAGYAKRHPELVGAFMQTCASDYQSEVLRETLNSLDKSVDNIACALKKST